MADRHGYVQTVLDTAPQVVDQLISDANHYPNTDNVRSLIAAGINAANVRWPAPTVATCPTRSPKQNYECSKRFPST